ncbi:hypothetical protein IWW38_004346 [Coemansia aciculifera]|uniref:Uncharacterized protein n=1 Tax=Coemansia aciculifera TaxID=417176 RepID=A0ACC1LY51_9FUNG|nr:hypothetical protein IWW38_004346 [Coemansia aciculifera]
MPATASSLNKVASTPPVVDKFKPNVSNTNVPAKSKPSKAQQPMKSAVVERSALASATDQETVDEEMHAREIAQAYNRMRFAKLAAGKLEDAANVAERILASTPGVTLIESNAPKDDGDEDNVGDYTRIELPEDPSPFSSGSLGNQPPEVVHQPKKTLAPVTAQASETEAQQPVAKPKMSRFKAQRLGLDS